MGKKLWITTGIIGALAAAYTAGGFLGVPYGVNWALKKICRTDRRAHYHNTGS